MREDLTYIAIVLDRSGSMESVREDTIGGFNAFVEEQRKAPGQALLTLVLFDDQYEVPISAQPLETVPTLTYATYVPRGGTALLEAIGRTIDTVGEQLAEMREEDRPGKVLVMIQTDGYENASKPGWPRERIKAMITHQREKYQWAFVFIGATEGAIADAAAMGIASNFMNFYRATPEGTANVMRDASAGTVHYRSLNSAEAAELQENGAVGGASFFDGH